MSYHDTYKEEGRRSLPPSGRSRPPVVLAHTRRSETVSRLRPNSPTRITSRAPLRDVPHVEIESRVQLLVAVVLRVATEGIHVVPAETLVERVHSWGLVRRREVLGEESFRTHVWGVTWVHLLPREVGPPLYY